MTVAMTETDELLARIESDLEADEATEDIDEEADDVADEAEDFSDMRPQPVTSPGPVLVHYDPGAGPVAMENGDGAHPVIMRGVLTPEVVAMRQAEQAAGAAWLLNNAGIPTPEVPETPEERAAREAAEAEQARIDAEERAERERLEEERRAAYEAEQARLAAEREAARLAQEQALQAQALETVEKIHDYIGSYLVLPAKYREAYLDVMTMWVLHTYSYKTSGVSPYLNVIAPTKGSGKTTVLEILSTLAHNPSSIEVGPTAPVVRLYASQGHTLFLDEIDTLASDKTFVGVMNSGYKSGGSVTRVARSKGDDTTVKSSTFCPKAIAGIAEEGNLPLPAATLDRCINIRIFRAKPGELTKRFRVDIMKEDAEVIAMRDWMTMWSVSKYRDIRDMFVQGPQLSSSRAEQIWEPLITIAGVIGGDWADRLRAAALLLDGATDTETETNSAMVEDVATVIRAYMEATDAESIRADDLASLRDVVVGRKLSAKLAVDKMVRRLGAFGIAPVVVKQDDADVLVYRIRKDGEILPEWDELFSRYAS
jgi:hypothetical protein